LSKVDPETGEYVRDSNGFCVPAGVNEPGELIGEIPDETVAAVYTDANTASKKVFLVHVTVTV
jgi:hypothetical protein